MLMIFCVYDGYIPSRTIAKIFIVFLVFERKVIFIYWPHIRVVAPPLLLLLLLLVRSDHTLALIALSHLTPLRQRGRCPVSHRHGRVARFVHQPARVGGEPLIDLLETLARGFDDEEVDERDEGRVQHRVEQVQAPVEVVDADGGGLDDDVVEEPVAGRGEGGAFGAHAQRVDFGRVEPGDGDPAEAEGQEVEGYEDRRDDARDVVPVVVADFRADGDSQEGDGHGGGHGH